MSAIYNPGKLLAAGLLLGAATMTVTALRKSDITPLRPVPEFRALGPANAPVVINEFSDFASRPASPAPNTLSAWYPPIPARSV